jgi:undecaprenyl-diphosphatase
MIEWLTSIDNILLLWINSLHGPILDEWMSLISAKYTWIPVYVFGLVGLWKILGPKGFLVSLLLIGAMMFLSDWGSVHFFKDTVRRYRPCHNLELKSMLHLVDGHCGGMYGFVSSHAANHFAVAVFLYGSIGLRWKWVKPAVLVWASLVAVSRVYLGVHYPSDVFVGGLYGGLIAVLALFVLDHRVLQRNLKP